MVKSRSLALSPVHERIFIADNLCPIDAGVGSGEYRPEIDEDDRSEFDPEECNDIVRGKWVFNASLRPLYSDRSCAYLEKQVTCKRNGRPDSDYLHWEWQPDDCYLPKSVENSLGFLFGQ